MKTALAIVNTVLDQLGLSRASSITNTGDKTVIQMLSLMNLTGQTLMTETDYQFLAAETRFSTVFKTYTGDTTAGSNTITNLSSVVGLTTDFMVSGAGIETDTFLTAIGLTTATLSIPASATSTGVTLTFGQCKYSVPSDYDRLENDTVYNKSNKWAVLGPRNAQEWQWIKSSWASAGPMMRFRIMQNRLTLWPMPSSVLTIGYEYISKNWALDNAGVGKAEITLDTDTSQFPDILMILGTRYRFQEAKGFDSSASFAAYKREESKFIGQNSGAEKLNLAPRAADRLLTTANLPDSGYGSN